MDNYPFDTVGLGCDQIELFNDTYKTLKSKFHIETTGNIDFQLGQFEVFRRYEGINVRGSYAIKQNTGNDCYVVFVEGRNSATTKDGRRYDYYKYLTWAIAFVKNDFDRVLIRRETLTDKIIELVHPVELDFDDDKPFSDTFYVLVNDRRKAELAINRNFRNAVMDIRHDDFVIEIMEHTLIIGDQNPVSPERAIYLAEFVARLSSMC